jgi:hypothetical protein
LIQPVEQPLASPFEDDGQPSDTQDSVGEFQYQLRAKNGKPACSLTGLIYDLRVGSSELEAFVLSAGIGATARKETSRTTKGGFIFNTKSSEEVLRMGFEILEQLQDINEEVIPNSNQAKLGEALFVLQNNLRLCRSSPKSVKNVEYLISETKREVDGDVSPFIESAVGEGPTGKAQGTDWRGSAPSRSKTEEQTSKTTVVCATGQVASAHRKQAVAANKETAIKIKCWDAQLIGYKLSKLLLDKLPENEAPVTKDIVQKALKCHMHTQYFADSESRAKFVAVVQTIADESAFKPMEDKLLTLVFNVRYLVELMKTSRFVGEPMIVDPVRLRSMVRTVSELQLFVKNLIGPDDFKSNKDNIKSTSGFRTRLQLFGHEQCEYKYEIMRWSDAPHLVGVVALNAKHSVKCLTETTAGAKRCNPELAELVHTQAESGMTLGQISRLVFKKTQKMVKQGRIGGDHGRRLARRDITRIFNKANRGGVTRPFQDDAEAFEICVDDPFWVAHKPYGINASDVQATGMFGFEEALELLGKSAVEMMMKTDYIAIGCDPAMTMLALYSLLLYVDATHAVCKKRGVKAIAIMARGKHNGNKGRPVLIAIVNRESHVTFALLFAVLRVMVGKHHGANHLTTWAPRALMTDLATAAYKGVQLAFPGTAILLAFCGFHILKAVGEELHESDWTSAVGGTTVAQRKHYTKVVKKLFSNAMYASTKAQHDKDFKLLLDYLSKNGLDLAHGYIMKQWSGTDARPKSMWAYYARDFDCFSTGNGTARSNVLCESFFKILKHSAFFGFGGKRNRYISVAIRECQEICQKLFQEDTDSLNGIGTLSIASRVEAHFEQMLKARGKFVSSILLLF